MYPLDNGKQNYTWKESWNLPCESLWGRIEKFRCANVLDGSHLNKFVSIGSQTDTHFSGKHLIYHMNSYKVQIERDFFLIDNSIHKKFIGISGLFEHRIRYCPECMKNGYHSFLHQLTIMDNCFIHENSKLQYRCECPNTYVVKKRNLNAEIYQCDTCNKKIPESSSVYDGITNMWHSPLIQSVSLPSYDGVEVCIFDFSYLHSAIFIKLDDFKKQVLQELILKGSTAQKPRYVVQRQVSFEMQSHTIAMSHLLNQYLSERFDYNTIMKHIGHISSRFQKYDIEHYDIEILTILYIIKELQLTDSIDLLPYKNTWGRQSIDNLFEQDNRYTPIVEDIMFNVFRLLKIRLEEYADVYNIILKEWTETRYRHIYSCFQNNTPEPYPCLGTAQVSYKNWKYPTYILQKKMDGSILIY